MPHLIDDIHKHQEQVEIIYQSQPQPQPNANVYSMEQKEKEFVLLHRLIAHKKLMLLNKNKEFRRIQSENRFLKSVRKNYLRYNEVIMRQKQQQIELFLRISYRII